MKKDFMKNQYEKGIDQLFSNMTGFNFDNYLSNIYNQKVPNYFKKYLAPEKEYVENLAFELNDYLSDIQNNLHKNIRNNPKKAMKTNLEDLIFRNEKEKQNFCNKIFNSVEELSYATNVLAAEAYKIWNVKYNTPGIGKIARKKLKDITGEEDLPEFSETKNKIENLKQETYIFLEYFGFDSNEELDQEVIKKAYQNKMKSFGDYTDGRRLLAYDLGNGTHEPKNARQEQEIFEENTLNQWGQSRGSKLEEMTESERNVDFEKFRQRKVKQRKKEAMGNNYNSWWEKLVAYVGYFFGL